MKKITQKSNVLLVLLLLGFHFSASSQCVPLFDFTTIDCDQTVQFTATSPIGGNITYTWDFGDGNQGMGQNVSHTYQAFGTGMETFNVTLTINNQDIMCEASISEQVTIDRIPDATISDCNTFSPFTYCDGTTYTLQIQNESSTVATNMNCTIDWGDDSPVFMSPNCDFDKIEHTYTGEGFFQIVVTTSNSNGCTVSSGYSFYMGGNPAVGVGIPPLGNDCAPLSVLLPIVNFEQNSIGTSYTVIPSDGQEPLVFTHPPPEDVNVIFNTSSCGFTSQGGFEDAFHVSIIASNPCGESAGTAEPIRISSPPTAAMEIDYPNNACPDEIFEFCDASVSPGFYITSIGQCTEELDVEWSISPATFTLQNGSELTDECIDVSFDVPGDYSVTISVSNPCNDNSGGSVAVEMVTVAIPPIADATFDDSMGSNCAPYTLTFENASSFNTTNCWNISGGSFSFANGESKNTASPTITFQEAGSYNVELVVGNDCGEATWDTIIIVNDVPSASLPAIEDACETTTITPTANITDNGCAVTSCVWTFQNGSIPSFTGCDPPEVTFDTPGMASITLAVTNCCGTNTVTEEFMIQAPITNVAVNPDTTLCADDPCIELIGFPADGSFSGAVTTNEFCPEDFGPGTYTIVYTFGDGLCSASDMLTIEVIELPQFSQVPIDQNLCEDDAPIQLESIPEGTWSGDGVTPQGIFDPAQAGIGQHDITVTIGDSTSNCSASNTFVITVIELPNLDIDDNTAFCNVPEINLEDELEIVEPPGADGDWDGPGMIDSETGTFSPEAAGFTGNDTSFNFIYMFESSDGCFAIDTIEVGITEPQAANVGPDTTICISEETLQLTANLQDFGTWEGNVISEDGLVDLRASGNNSTFAFTAFSSTTCETSDELNLTIISVEDIDAGSDRYFCETESIITLDGFSLPQNAIGNWAGEGIIDPVIGSIDIQTLVPGTCYTYSLNVESSLLAGCIDQDEIELCVAALPQGDLDISGSTCEDSTIVFTNLIEEQGVTTCWDFGDESPQVCGQSVSYTYAAEGDYTVTMTLTTNNPLLPAEVLCTNVFTTDITISQPPEIIAFDADPLSGCADLELNLENISVGESLSFAWFLDTTLFSTDFNPENLILTGGRNDTTYTLTLTTNNFCGDGVASQEITVRPQPRAFFGSNADTYCSGDSIFLSNNSYGQPTTYEWFLNQNLISTDSMPPEIVYLTEALDSIEICLVVLNDCGMDTFCIQVEVIPTDVNAFFNISEPTACAEDTICFTNLSTFGADLIYDFGDGNTSTATNPCHVYAAPGQYTVTLRADGCGFDLYSIPITIEALPLASYTNPEFICLGDTILFENTSVDGVSYTWDFGDGTSSILASPLHVYDSIDVFEVCLTATAQNGCQDIDCKLITVEALPQAGFMLVDSICAGTPITISSNASSNFECFYQFGDGNTSSECNPTYTYMEPGDYTITQIISNTLGCPDTATQFIHVRSIPQPAFEFTVADPCHPSTVFFNNLSLNADSYVWQFGDDSTSTVLNPMHTYEAPGQYTIELTAIKDGFCIEIITQTILIEETPVANFAPSALNGCAPFEIQFDNTSTGANTAWNWDFGDGFFSFEENPSHVFDTIGDFTVRLIVQNEDCADTMSIMVSIYEPVTINAMTTDILCNGAATGAIEVSIASGTSPFNYKWSNNTEEEDLENLLAGTYTITITDANNCVLEENFTINQPEAIQANLTSDYSIVSCFGGADGILCIDIEGGTPDYTLNWATGSTEDCLTNIAAGVYPLTITDANSCIIEQVFQMEENTPIVPDQIISDVTCFGFDDGFVDLNAISGGTEDYFPNLSGPDNYSVDGFFFDDLVPGDYVLTIIDSEDCLYEEAITITEPDSLWMFIQEDTIDLKLGAESIIRISHNGLNPSFLWSPDRELTCVDCPEPITQATNDITYTLLLTDFNGCQVEDEVFVDVDKTRTVFIPNVFTPNGDGRNDVFRVLAGGLAISNVNAFRVYDRFGELLFEAKDFIPSLNSFDNSWDGTFRGKRLSPDVFIYYAEIEYVDGFSEILKGEVTLIR